MILFREDMKQAILNGRKTVTRRRGKCRWCVGAEHLLYTRPAFARPPGKPFARVRIVGVSREESVGRWLYHRQGGGPVHRLDAEREAQREGFDSWFGFREAYQEINGDRSFEESCWRVEFALVERLEAEGQ